MDEFEEARKLALAIENPAAMVAATTGKVKLFGLDKPSKVDHTSSDGSMSPKPLDLSKMSDAALAELQAAMNASPDTDEG